MRLAGVSRFWTNHVRFLQELISMAKKLQLGYREIEQRLVDSFSQDVNSAEVGYQLLYSFGKSERDIERYK